MSIIQELENIMGVSLPEPFNYIVVSLIVFFCLAFAYNFIKLIFRLFYRN